MLSENATRGWEMTAFVFLAALGLFLFLYTLHFRHQAHIMGPLPLRRALERAMSRGSSDQDEGGREDGGSTTPVPTEEELREEVRQLKRRLTRWATGFLSMAVLSALSGFLAFSRLSGLALALFGVGILGAFLSASALLIRDILVFLGKDLGN